MSPGTALLARLEAAGVTLREHEGVILAGPREAVTDDLRALIRSNKADLLAAIEARDPFINDLLRLFPGSRILP